MEGWMYHWTPQQIPEMIPMHGSYKINIKGWVMLLQGNNLISILHVFHGLHCETHTGDLYRITSCEHLVEEPMKL